MGALIVSHHSVFTFIASRKRNEDVACYSEEQGVIYFWETLFTAALIYEDFLR
jgi:hypothetical protein